MTLGLEELTDEIIEEYRQFIRVVPLGVVIPLETRIDPFFFEEERTMPLYVDPHPLLICLPGDESVNDLCNPDYA